MITVEVTCTCKECKQEFTCKAECRDEIEANFKYSKFQNRAICPECVKKENMRKAEEQAKKYKLPVIIGYTDRQIAYASSLRNQYIQKHASEIQYVQEQLEKINPAMISSAAEKRGIDPSLCVEQAFMQIGAGKAYVCLREKSAKRIIEVLKG